MTLLGVGVVTGDAWLREEEAHVLRFLEIAGRSDIPVLGGAEMPLLRTRAEMQAWEAQYGGLAWKGAWNDVAPGKSNHPDDPGLVPPLPEGAPSHRVAAENAVDFLIRTVHSHPGEVTVIAAGPLTNIALALRLDPALPHLAKALVLQGGYLNNIAARVSGNANYGTDFNFIFDPEAAHIVLTAPWTSITVLGDVTGSVRMTADLAARIGAAPSPVAHYIATYASIGQPLWDEITVAVGLDDSLIRASQTVRMDVDLLPGPTYGFAQVWPADRPAGTGAQIVRLVDSIDADRFLAEFTAQAAQ